VILIAKLMQICGQFSLKSFGNFEKQTSAEVDDMEQNKGL